MTRTTPQLAEKAAPPIARHVREQEPGHAEPGGTAPERTLLSDYRKLDAWVLIAAPGAGKTTAMQSESAATPGGLYMTVAQFMIDAPKSNLDNSVLFLDALDEYRASSSGTSIALRVGARLRESKIARFRIACRSADWFGDNDFKDIFAAQSAKILELASLTDSEVKTIVVAQVGDTEANQFLRDPQVHEIRGALENPQFLLLLLHAFSGGKRPTSKTDMFEFACEKLATEANSRHEDAMVGRLTCSVNELLNAAGFACAVILLGQDAEGLALRTQATATQYPLSTSLALKGNDLAVGALDACLHTKLFRGEGTLRVVPLHRTVAEYLAARWLATRLKAGMPQRRILALLEGIDGATVGALRGLYAWLATLAPALRDHIVQRDPLTLIAYADVVRFAVSEKRSLWNALRTCLQDDPYYLRRSTTATLLSPLAIPELKDEIAALLAHADRSEFAQASLQFALVLMEQNQALNVDTSQLLRIVRDATYWPTTCTKALDIWLTGARPAGAALTLLDDVFAGVLSDPCGRLASALLSALYPMEISPRDVLKYWNRPQGTGILGTDFWSDVLVQKTQASDTAIVLDGLAAKQLAASPVGNERELEYLVDSLFAKAISGGPTATTTAQTARWLAIAHDNLYHHRESKLADSIAQWLAKPERYRALVLHYYDVARTADCPATRLQRVLEHLRDVTLPDGMSAWHIQQAPHETNERLRWEHIASAVRAARSLTDKKAETIAACQALAARNPEHVKWLNDWLFPSVDSLAEWQVERDEQHANAAAARRQESNFLRASLSAICNASLPRFHMYNLAGVWRGRFANSRPASPGQRFSDWYADGADILEAAEAGFRHLALSTVEPSCEEVLQLHKANKQHYFTSGICIGMELIWQDSPAQLGQISEDAMKRAIACAIADGPDYNCAWLAHFAESHAVLFADVYVKYAGARIRSNIADVWGLHQLAYSPSYSAVAKLATEPLLRAFPTHASSGNLATLLTLLVAAEHHGIDVMPLVERKLKARTLDAGPHAYWLMFAALSTANV